MLSRNDFMIKKRNICCVAILFFLWILPLGVFIKPGKERQACDGRRGVCMCTPSSATKTVADGPALASMSGGLESKESAGGAMTFMCFSRLLNMSAPNGKFYHPPNSSHYQSPSFPVRDPVPKV